MIGIIHYLSFGHSAKRSYAEPYIAGSKASLNENHVCSLTNYVQ